MKKRYVLEGNEYEGKETFNLKKAMFYFVAVVVSGVTLFLAGCSQEYQQGEDYPNKETPFVPIITSSSTIPVPTIEQTAEPTPKPTPTATPQPTSEPMTIDEKIAKFETSDVYGDSVISLNQLGFVDYIIDGENKMTFFMLGDGIDKRDGQIKVLFFNVPDACPMFSMSLDNMETYGYGMDGYTYYELYADGYYGGSLEVLNAGWLSEFESVLASKGVSVPQTKYSEKINDPKAKGYMRASEIVEYLATVLPDSYCVFHEDLVGSKDYPTPSPTK